MSAVVCVTGGRLFDDVECVHRTLNAIHDNYGIARLAHGGATGADTLAASWARTHKVPVAEYKANWKKYGRGAGPVRNCEMLDTEKPQLLIVFPGGVGTAHCTNAAKTRGIVTIEAIPRHAAEA